MKKVSCSKKKIMAENKKLIAYIIKFRHNPNYPLKLGTVYANQNFFVVLISNYSPDLTI